MRDEREIIEQLVSADAILDTRCAVAAAERLGSGKGEGCEEPLARRTPVLRSVLLLPDVKAQRCST